LSENYLKVFILCSWITFDNMILKMLHALPFLLQLLQKDNITGNEIANSHMGCLLCAFLVVWGGGLFG